MPMPWSIEYHPSASGEQRPWKKYPDGCSDRADEREVAVWRHVQSLEGENARLVARVNALAAELEAAAKPKGAKR